MTDNLFCRFYIRGEGAGYASRGGARSCISASSSSYLKRIGSGKVVMPAHFDQSLQEADRVRPGDLCIAWTTAPDGVARRVAEFIVEKRQYRNGRLEFSGPDMLGELMDFVVMADVGAETQITTTGMSMGNYDPEGPTGTTALDAAYPPRAYTTAALAGPGDTIINLTGQIKGQPSDWFSCTLVDGTFFTSEIKAISNQNYRIELATPLRANLPGGVKIRVVSYRVRVASVANLQEGQPIYFRPIPSISQPQGSPYSPGDVNMVIDRVEDGEGDAPDYIYFREIITWGITPGTVMYQLLHAAPTTDDVASLFRNSTFGFWTVVRQANIPATSYAAQEEDTVWDALTAIADMSGGVFRKRYGVSGPEATPLRQIDYFPAGTPPTGNNLRVIGTRSQMNINYGEILNLETDDSNPIITHVIPYGANGFDLREADFQRVMDEFPTQTYGVIGHRYFVTNIAQTNRRDIWRAKTFSHISPKDETSEDERRTAANQLLRAACEYLLDNSNAENGFVVDIHTLAAPEPGDVIETVEWNGVEPVNMSGANLSISEVHHEVTRGDGLRITRLVLNRRANLIQDGPTMIADMLTMLRRGQRGGVTSGGYRGGANVTARALTFQADGTVRAVTGAATLQSDLGNITINAPKGDILIRGKLIDIEGRIDITGEIRSDSGFVLPADNTQYESAFTHFSLRGIPRLLASYRRRPS